MLFKKISWFFKRHHFLYITRFKLLSKNSSVQGIKECTYNQNNKLKDIPTYFNVINNTIVKDFIQHTDLEFIKHLSIWLQNNIKGGPGLSEPSDTALKIMLEGKGGVCSDMAQIFNNFCVINNIQVREWGNTRAPFDKKYGGHSFNEVYIRELEKWILIDVSNSILFYFDSKILSVIELYNIVRSGKNVTYKSFNPAYIIEANNITKNYLNPNTVPFLICNYSNRTYDSFLRTLKPVAPVFVVHFLLLLIGKSYHYRFPLDDYNKIFS